MHKTALWASCFRTDFLKIMQTEGMSKIKVYIRLLYKSFVIKSADFKRWQGNYGFFTIFDSLIFLLTI